MVSKKGAKSDLAMSALFRYPLAFWISSYRHISSPMKSLWYQNLLEHYQGWISLAPLLSTITNISRSIEATASKAIQSTTNLWVQLHSFLSLVLLTAHRNKALLCASFLHCKLGLQLSAPGHNCPPQFFHATSHFPTWIKHTPTNPWYLNTDMAPTSLTAPSSAWRGWLEVIENNHQHMRTRILCCPTRSWELNACGYSRGCNTSYIASTQLKQHACRSKWFSKGKLHSLPGFSSNVTRDTGLSRSTQLGIQ